MTNVLLLEKGGRREVLTRNLVQGARTYGEDLIHIESREYRAWDPFRSKLGGAMIKGLDLDVIREGDKVLYLGTSTGTTPSHVSDIIGPKGILIGVESSMRVGREFVENVAKHRKNIIPYIADARSAEKFGALGRVDVVYCDIAQPDQTEIAIANCTVNLKKGGRLLLIVKARSIDVMKEPRDVFKAEKLKLDKAGFIVEKVVELSPFDKDHALISARVQA
jgi:fibrillarin-like pre-rRNA processing protein